MTQRRCRILLVCIILIGGFTKMSFFFWVQAVEPNRIFLPDSASYINTARAFLKTGHFAVSPDMPNVPQLIRTPGYPLLIANLFFWFGEKFTPLIITQILLSLGSILMTYRIAAILWDSNVAVISAVLLSLDIPSFIGSQKVLTETFFTLVLSVAMISVIDTLRKPQHVVFLALLHGILLSLATLIRPITYYLIFPVILTFLIILKSHLGLRWKKIVIIIAAVLIPWIILVGGWQLRNYLITGKAEFSYIQSVNLLFYLGAGIVAQKDGITFEEAQQRLGYKDFAELPPEVLSRSIAELSQQWKRESLRLFFQHPWFLLKDQGRGFLKMLFMPGEDCLLGYIGDYREKTGPVGDLFTLSFTTYIRKWVLEKTMHFALFLFTESTLLLMYASIVFSLWRVIKTKDGLWSTHLFIWIVILYFIATSVNPGAYYRFRIPIMPLFSVYAGHGLYQILQRFSLGKPNIIPDTE